MEDPRLTEHSCVKDNLSMSSPGAMRGATDRFSFERAGKWLLFWLLLMAIVVGLAVLFRPETPAVIIYPAEAQWKYKVPVPDRWIPIGWGWYWRTKELVFGKRRAVSTLAVLRKVPEPAESLQAALSPAGAAYVHVDGTRICIIKASRYMGGFTTGPRGVEVSSARIQSGDGMAARMFTGTHIAVAGETREVGIALNVWHSHRRGATDLKAALMGTEFGESPEVAVVTNFCISGRFQIPRGDALMLLKPGKTNDVSETTVLFLYPQWK